MIEGKKIHLTQGEKRGEGEEPVQQEACGCFSSVLSARLGVFLAKNNGGTTDRYLEKWD